MNRIVAIVAGLHVLAHSVFGCCGHDSHSVTMRATDSAVLSLLEFSGEQHFSEPDEGGGCHDHCVGTVDVEVVVHAKADCPLCAIQSLRSRFLTNARTVLANGSPLSQSTHQRSNS